MPARIPCEQGGLRHLQSWHNAIPTVRVFVAPMQEHERPLPPACGNPGLVADTGTIRGVEGLAFDDRIHWGMSGKVVAHEMEKDWSGKAEGIEAVHDAAVAGNEVAVVLDATVTLHGGHDETTEESHEHDHR